MPIVNPADESPIGILSLGTEKDVDHAVAAASAALPSWSATSREERLAALERIASLYQSRLDEIAQAVCTEMGAPLWLCHELQAPVGMVQLQSTIAALREFPLEAVRGSTRVVREPVGVVALVTPWNWPLNQITAKVAPALAAGCTVVLKPSEITPLDARVFTDIVHEAGLPPGVFNMVFGEGHVVGSALARHRGVDMISITGSTRAGIEVAMQAAPSVKRVTQELGGKSPNLILDDADLKAAVSGGVVSCMVNSGQTCIAPTRMLVPRALYAQAVAIAVATVNALVVGDPRHADTKIGPLSNRRQYERVQHMIDIGIKEGARLVVGGPGRPPGLDRGFYARPTVFADVSNDMAIAREEIFGPVLVMIPYDSEEDGIAIANDTPYGLASYVWSRDTVRAQRVARRIRAGTVQINGARLDLTAPFGGVKASGNGREFGEVGLSEYLEYKSIVGAA